MAQRISIVVSSLGGGGTERVVVDLSAHLVHRGREVTVLTLNGDDPDFYQLPSGVRRERMEIRRHAASMVQSVKFTWQQLISIRQRIKSLKPDVVLSFIDQANIRTTMSLLGSGIPVVISERVHPGVYQIPKPWARLRKMFYRFADATVVQTDEIASWFKQNLPTKRLVTIPNAVRSSDGWSKRAAEPERIVLSVGRLVPQKGFDILLRSFAKSDLIKQGWQLIILGDGPERSNLLELRDKLALTSGVQMPGHVNNVSDWMARAAIFALPSRFEGFPNALLEAMQMGIAPVSSDCPSGPRDLIDDGKNGLLTPVGDVEALATALRKLADDEPLRFSIGQEAVKVIERFSPEWVYGLWVETLDQVSDR